MSNVRKQYINTRSRFLFITLSVKWIKRQQLADWIFKRQDSSIYCVQKTQFKHKNTKILKVKRCYKIFHVNYQKRAIVAKSLSENINFKSEKVISTRRTLYIDKRFNILRKENSYKYRYTYQKCSQIGKLNIVKVTILAIAIHTFNTIPIKIPLVFFKKQKKPS